MKHLLATLAVIVPSIALAQPAPPVPLGAQAEIEHLFQYISATGCRFERNGTWHDTAAARAHVNMKYQYMLDRGKVDSAEAFIEGAASRSSLSGKDYLVQCPGQPAVPSAGWLREELERFRGHRG